MGNEIQEMMPGDGTHSIIPSQRFTSFEAFAGLNGI